MRHTIVAVAIFAAGLAAAAGLAFGGAGDEKGSGGAPAPVPTPFTFLPTTPPLPDSVGSKGVAGQKGKVAVKEGPPAEAKDPPQETAISTLPRLREKDDQPGRLVPPPPPPPPSGFFREHTKVLPVACAERSPGDDSKGPNAVAPPLPQPVKSEIPPKKEAAQEALPGGSLPPPAAPAPAPPGEATNRKEDAEDAPATWVRPEPEREQLLGTWKVTAASGDFHSRNQDQCRWAFGDRLVVKDGRSSIEVPYIVTGEGPRRTLSFRLLGQRWTGTYCLLDDDTVVIRLAQPGAAAPSVVVLLRDGTAATSGR